MILVRDISILDEALKPSVVAIGFFDGVHLGHHYLIEQVKKEASARGLCAALVTFPVHPRKVMNSLYKPELLTSYTEKLELLEAAGIDYCFSVDFTPEMSRMTAYDFMRLILKERYNVRGLVIGYDHRFGHNRSEGFEDCSRFGQELGIEVIQAQARIVGDMTISSSAIRRLLYVGDVTMAVQLLGYEYHLTGTVVGGHKIGRTIGFPTANLRIDDSEKLIPADGVYAVRVAVDNQVYGGMLNIGYRPTVDSGRNRSIEVHIFHFNADIYDQQIRISFVQRVRSEIKFAGKEELIQQLIEDARVIEPILLEE